MMKARLRASVACGWMLACVPGAVLAQAEPSAPGAKQATAAFDIWEYRLLGNTKLAPLDIERTLYPFLGPAKTFDSIEAARTAMEKYYHDQGFGTVYVDIPEQEVKDGIVRLHVTEGRLGRVRISGARFFANKIIRAEVPEAQVGTVPNINSLQQQLAALNSQTADRAVAPVLRAGKTPGTVDLELKVQDRLPLHTGLELNNGYTADTNTLRANVSLAYENLWQSRDSLSLQYQGTPQDLSNVKVYAGTYVHRFGSGKPALAFYAVSSNSDVATIGTLSVLGVGKIFGTRLVLPIDSGAGRSENITLGLDYKKFRNNITVTKDQRLGTYVRYLPLSVNYSLNLAGEHSTTAFSGGLTWAIRGLGGTASQFEDSRYLAKTNFFYFRGSASRLQELPWRLSLNVDLDAQFAAEPLISNEQFSAGGQQNVRGYYEAEELGDSGIRGAVELRSPPLQAAFWNQSRAYAYTFYDGALLSLRSPLPGQDRSTTLHSVGLGLRVSTLDRLDANIDWAYVLESAQRTQRGDSRFNFSVRYAF
jgi:hemolysin activation/secretion protein